MVATYYVILKGMSRTPFQPEQATDIVASIDDLISFWSFQEEAGQKRVASIGHSSSLYEGSSPLQREKGGIFGSYALRVSLGQWLYIPRAECPLLNIYGHKSVSVVVWLVRHKNPAIANKGEFIAGIWDEYNKRQYGLFLNLKEGAVLPENQGLDTYGYSNQVIGHVSDTGTASPGHQWCRTAFFSASPVPLQSWQCVAMSYDGYAARSYLNGVMEPRPKLNPFALLGGLFNPGIEGGNFYVGANPVPGHEDMQANPFEGLIGGLAVFARALKGEEMQTLASLIQTR